jgi:hypothetical protein
MNTLLRNAQAGLPADQRAPKARRRRPLLQEEAAEAAEEAEEAEAAGEEGHATEAAEVPEALPEAAAAAAESSSSGRALSFVVVVQHAPQWAGWQTLARSPFLARMEVLPRSAHGFVNGARHFGDSAKRTRPSGDSTLFLLQTAAAAVRWPCTDDAVAHVRAAFEAPAVVEPPRAPKPSLSGHPVHGELNPAAWAQGDRGRDKGAKKSGKRARDPGYRPQTKPSTRAIDNRQAKKRYGCAM